MLPLRPLPVLIFFAPSHLPARDLILLHMSWQH
jgi:hypothetical protein